MAEWNHPVCLQLQPLATHAVQPNTHHMPATLIKSSVQSYRVQHSDLQEPVHLYTCDMMNIWHQLACRRGGTLVY